MAEKKQPKNKGKNKKAKKKVELKDLPQDNKQELAPDQAGKVQGGIWRYGRWYPW